jgi:hypothetical protein
MKRNINVKEKTVSIVTALTMILLMFVFMPKTAYGTIPINVNAGGSKIWGTPQFVQENILVNNDDEISKGKAAWVFSSQSGGGALGSYVFPSDWERLVNGDFSELVNQIENAIPGSKVRWIQVKWDQADYVNYPRIGYIVKGFFIETIVENVGAKSSGFGVASTPKPIDEVILTGLGIAAIIMAVAVLAAVVGAIILGFWITHQLVLAVSQIPPIFQIPIYLILLIFIGAFLLILFGKLSLPDLIRSLKGKGKRGKK